MCAHKGHEGLFLLFVPLAKRLRQFCIYLLHLRALARAVHLVLMNLSICVSLDDAAAAVYIRVVARYVAQRNSKVMRRNVDGRL
jgi:hypothetical protein